MAYKFAINAGHGYNTPGKRCDRALDPNTTREWTLSSRIVEKIIKGLEENYTGFEYIRLDDPTGAKNVALSKRVSDANNFGAVDYYSIHHNAAGKLSTASGIMVYTYTNVGNDTATLQKMLYDKLIEKTGLKGNRAAPLAKADLYECRYTRMNAVLAELGFMDSVKDVPIILTETFADQCAEAFIEVIVKRGKLTKKAKAPVVQPETSYRVKVNTAVLNIRNGAGTDFAKVGAIKDRGVYTIVEERAGKGASKWGKLKSGAGWISLDYTKRI